MAYYDDTYYDPVTTGASDMYPLQGMPPIGEEIYTQMPDSLAVGWEMVGQPGLYLEPNLQAPTLPVLTNATNYETVASAPSYVSQASGYGQPPYPAPEFPPQPEPEPLSSLSWDGSFTNTLTLGASDAMAVPNDYPPGFWGQNQSEPVSGPSSFYPDVQSSYQPSAGLTETGSNLTGRFHPYAHRTRTTRYANAEAEPPTVAPPYDQYGGQHIPEPSGGIVSETSADAENNQPTTEQYKAPRRKVKRNRASTAGWRPRRHQPEIDEMSPRLFAWVRMWNNGRDPVNFNEALAVALDVISMIRPPIRILPYFSWGSDKPAPRPKSAERKREQELFEEISTRYVQEVGKRAWVRPDLLARVLKDLEENFPQGSFKPSTP